MAIYDLEVDDLEIELDLSPALKNLFLVTPPPTKKEDEETDNGEDDE